MELREELPYEMAVVVDAFKDMRLTEKDKKRLMREGNSEALSETAPDGRLKIVASIEATIIVNKPSQRAIVVGKGGTVIKDIGIKSRAKIESLIGGKVFLNLHVKVVSKWFKNNIYLEQVGLLRAMDSKRVWRKR